MTRRKSTANFLVAVLAAAVGVPLILGLIGTLWACCIEDGCGNRCTLRAQVLNFFNEPEETRGPCRSSSPYCGYGPSLVVFTDPFVATHEANTTWDIELRWGYDTCNVLDATRCVLYKRCYSAERPPGQTVFPKDVDVEFAHPSSDNDNNYVAPKLTYRENTDTTKSWTMTIPPGRYDIAQARTGSGNSTVTLASKDGGLRHIGTFMYDEKVDARQTIIRPTRLEIVQTDQESDIYDYVYSDSPTYNTVVVTHTKKENGELLEKQYYCERIENNIVRRRRVTVERRNTDPTKQFETTVCVFYSTGETWPGALHDTAPPDGVVEYLKANPGDGINPDDPSEACNLDDPNTVLDSTLINFASAVYKEYETDSETGEYQVTWETSYGGGCCGGAAKSARYKHGSTGDLKWRRIQPVDDVGNIAQGGARTVEFYNADNHIVFKVDQVMDYTINPPTHPRPTITQKWITHYLYNAEGWVSEKRYPSACTTYTSTPVDVVSGETALQGEWVDDITPDNAGTAGDVRLYEYSTESESGSPLTSEKIRNGTSAAQPAYHVRDLSYTSIQYDGHFFYELATETVYPTAWDGTGGPPADRQVTTYDYTYYRDGSGNVTPVVETRKVIPPTTSAAHNGPGVSAPTLYHYKQDAANGRYLYFNDWTKNADGAYSYTELGTDSWNFGQVVKTITDANSNASDVSGFPGGSTGTADWPVRTTGLHVETVYDYYSDADLIDTVVYANYGQLKSVTDPDGKRTVYASKSREITSGEGEDLRETTVSIVNFVAPQMDEDGNYGYAPVQMTVSDMAGHTITSAAGAPTTSTDGDLLNDLSSAYYADPTKTIVQGFQGTLTARGENVYENEQIKTADSYYDIANDHYYRTAYYYDDLGRQYKVWQYKDTYTAEGDPHVIAWTEYDQLSRATETWAGTNDTDGTPGNPSDSGANNMKKTGATFYDEATPGSGTSGVGDGYVTSTRGYYDAADVNNYVQTAYHYNWRGYLRGVEPEAAPFSVQDVDNMGRAVASAQFNSTSNFGGATWPTVLANETYAAAATDANRRTLSKTFYDDQGRVYRTETYAVNSATGTAGAKLVTENFYDAMGRLAGTTSPARGGMEYAYDGAGRLIEVRSVKALKDDKYQGTAYAYRDPQPGAASGGNEGVIQITRTSYDAAGNTIQTLTLEANHDDTDGIWLTSGQEDFVQSGSQAWYDEVGRQNATAYYGSGDPNNEWKYAPPPARADSPPAASGAGLLVTRYAYNSAGRLETVTDPKGIVTKSFYDDLGRRVQTVENVVHEFTVGASNYSQGTSTDIRVVPNEGLNVNFDEFTSDGNTLGLWHLHHGYYPGEGTGLEDASGNGHTFTNYGADPCEDGYSFVRANDDYMSASLGSLAARNQCTMEAWVRAWLTTADQTGYLLRQIASANDVFQVIARRSATPADSYIELDYRNNGVWIAVGSNCRWSGTDCDALLGGADPWHVAAVLDAPNTVTLFVNGIQRASYTTGIVAMRALTYNLYVGLDGGNGPTSVIDEVRLSSVARYTNNFNIYRFKSSGVYESPTFDAGQNSATWSGINPRQVTPAGTSITWQVRAANTLSGGHPDAAWGAYDPNTPPAGRYFQWKATLTPGGTLRTTSPTLVSATVYASTGDDQNRSTVTVYDGLSNVTQLVADLNRDGQPTANFDQITTYTFDEVYNPSLPTKIQYPDGDDSNDNVQFTYYLDGAVHTRTSQKHATVYTTATVITFVYDATFHRLTRQGVTTLGTNVDPAVQAIAYSYDSLGRTEKVTSYDDPTAGNVVSEVQYAYNDLGMLSREYQAHAGAVNTETSPYVEYKYMDSAPEGIYNKGMRPKNVRYPNGRLVHYRYGSEGSRDEMISRLATIHDDSSGLPGEVLSEYAYSGLGRMASEHYPTPEVRLDYFQGAPPTGPGQPSTASRQGYAGLDRFGRVKDQRWRFEGSTPADLDRYTYGYDYGSNRLWRGNALTHGTANKFDEFYTYDGLQRLANADRGTLDDPPWGGILTQVFRQNWGLDQVGNWGTFKQDNSDSGATWSLDQERQHNAVNEITDITETTGPAWVTPSYDARGNMVSGPKPGDETVQNKYVYDAWNRMVKVTDANDATIAEYRYDGLNQRIVKLLPNGQNWDRTDCYYNSSWQCLEERYGANQAKETVATAAKVQWVWSARYIDAPVLRWRSVSGTLDEALYYCTDANMNVTALVNTDGSIAERYVYDPYGKVTIYDDDWSDTVSWANSKQNEILYCGYRFDNESGLYNPRTRYYHPTMGRWTSRGSDKYDYPNQYEYVRNNPIGNLDPSGKVLIAGYGVLIKEYPNKEAVQKACGRGASSCVRFNKMEITREVQKKADECGVVITELYWGLTIHILAAGALPPFEDTMRTYEKNRDLLRSLPPKAWYDTPTPVTFKSLLTHELEHAIIDSAIASEVIPLEVNIYNLLYWYPTMEEAKKKKVEHDAANVPEKEILNAINAKILLKYAAEAVKEEFGPEQATEPEAIMEERAKLEEQYQAWKAKKTK